MLTKAIGRSIDWIRFHANYIIVRPYFPNGVTLHGNVKLVHPHRISAGSGLHLNHNVYIQASGGVSIGENVVVSAGTSILSASLDYKEFWAGRIIHTYNGVTIGNNVWICSSVTIVPGVKISDFSIVAAGAVVTKSFPPYSLIGGNPASLIRYLNQPD